ncbi:hypothetical protein AGMMS4952_17520 [Spirochaetia bacterium]|nr:hypothetical protein AGMMS4952_17520 [Spirochaetia bacterium]
MSRFRWQLFVLLVLIPVMSVRAQAHVSVPLGDPVYHVLEQAEVRGLCAPLPTAKPYSRAVIVSAVNEILNAGEGRRFGGLSKGETDTLLQFLKTHGDAKKGIDWQKGSYRFENNENSKVHVSADVGARFGTILSGGYYFQDADFAFGADFWLTPYLKGDLGRLFSYKLEVTGLITRSAREELGKYNTYYDGYDNTKDSARQNDKITTYGDPLAYFPYTYKKRWDGFVWSVEDTMSSASMLGWPKGFSVGYNMMPELGGSLLDGKITYRGGRMDREWGAMANGSSLILNKSAQPFLGLEATVTPFNWLSFSSVTGVLEYFADGSLKESAASSQNAFTLGMIEGNYKNYFHADVGSAVVWPKRLELGYLFPLTDNFFYQNNVGDFDNLALFLNLKGQYPGIAGLWFSFFLDEVSPDAITKAFELDRAMFAFQAGGTAHLPFLPFGSLSLSYTKIEPYTYTHTKENVPWYGDIAMETSYINNGRALGYYLPPNSDEVKLRFEAMPELNTRVSAQYQMIRHGADFGPHAVDGSSFYSELDPQGRDEKAVLKKFFLEDGAYQWLHIIKVGAEHTFPMKYVPFQVFGEAGVVISYFTDIAGEANSGSASSYSIVDTSVYPKSTGFILTLGIRIFPE